MIYSPRRAHKGTKEEKNTKKREEGKGKREKIFVRKQTLDFKIS
jgi:hypothetical protein